MAVQAAILTLTFLVAWLVGMAFPLAGRIDSAGLAATGSRIYTADFMGAGLGAALASAWLIPVLGIGWTCLLVAGLNALAAVPLFLKPTS
jgi:predicted membrane-bound spermidine synthase